MNALAFSKQQWREAGGMARSYFLQVNQVRKWWGAIDLAISDLVTVSARIDSNKIPLLLFCSAKLYVIHDISPRHLRREHFVVYSSTSGEPKE